VGWPKDHYARTLLVATSCLARNSLRTAGASTCSPIEKGSAEYNDISECGARPEDVKKHQEAARLLVKHAVA